MNRRSLDWQICEELMDCPAGMTVTVLANELGASPAAIYEALYRLKDQGLVKEICFIRTAGGLEGLWKMPQKGRAAA